MSNIIVVDDDITNVQLIQMLLELDGFVVLPCTNLQQAADAINSKPVDAFVIDWHLERDTSGLDLLTAVRANQTKVAANTLIIMTSGDHRREQEALDAGANLFLLKPYPPDDLSNVLKEMLDGGVDSGK